MDLSMSLNCSRSIQLHCIMSYIKHHLHQQQELNDEFAAEYTADQLFVLNDIADEQEKIMQELMSPMENHDQSNWNECGNHW